MTPWTFTWHINDIVYIYLYSTDIFLPNRKRCTINPLVVQGWINIYPSIMDLCGPTNAHVYKQPTMIHHGLHNYRVVHFTIVIIRCTLIRMYCSFMWGINSPCSLWKAPKCLKTFNYFLQFLFLKDLDILRQQVSNYCAASLYHNLTNSWPSETKKTRQCPVYFQIITAILSSTETGNWKWVTYIQV